MNLLEFRQELCPDLLLQRRTFLTAHDRRDSKTQKMDEISDHVKA